MATVVVTLKIMPDSPETDLSQISKAVGEKIINFGGSAGKTAMEPVAFGLKALVIIFTMPEEKGSTEPLEQEISGLSGISSVQVTDVRRAIG